jgi:hypothetical protein
MLIENNEFSGSGEPANRSEVTEHYFWQQNMASPLKVNLDKAHIEHNTSTVTPIADVEAAIDFRRGA